MADTIAGPQPGHDESNRLPPAAGATTGLGSGHPLDRATCTLFEKELDADLGGVRVHEDAAAHAAADRMEAAAFTLGNHVVFARNRFAPNMSRGKWLLAHELTHVVQHANGAAPSVIHRSPKSQDEIDQLDEEALRRRLADNENESQASLSESDQRALEVENQTLKRALGETASAAGNRPPSVTAEYGPGEIAASAVSPGVVELLPDWTLVLSNFEVDKSALKPEHKSALRNLIATVRLDDSTVADERIIDIVGYTDGVNMTGHNPVLRAARSAAVRAFLSSQGSVDRLLGPAVTVADGVYRGDNNSSAGRASNRAAVVRMGPFPIPVTFRPEDGPIQSDRNPSTQRSVDPNPPRPDPGPNRSQDPTQALRIPSTEWRISSEVSGSATVFGGTLFLLTNKTTGFTYQVDFEGLTWGIGGKVGVAISQSEATDFTSAPLTVDQFNCGATIKFLELTVGAGGSIAYLGFTPIPTNPAQLDIGGLEAGASFGAGIQFGKTTVDVDHGIPPPDVSAKP
ncbi:eCIS core domain-containing protein [Mycobacterium sp.]|uniref:eCIS core domain-containing protein n=1 Tax=Mycobacterium sp. TaxID=1785 RepID=UPI003D10E9B5